MVILSPVIALGGLMFQRFQALGLGGQMAGDALIEPALDLGS
jgi:hypothetical protein